MALTSSAMLIADAATANNAAATHILNALGESRNPVGELQEAERFLTLALAECRIARMGIARRNPSFDKGAALLLIGYELQAIKETDGNKREGA